MLLAYKVLTKIMYPFLLILIFLRKIIKKENPARYKEKILISHFNINRKKTANLIWLHAASLGELKSIIPIVEKLNIDNKNLEFLITTLTLSSSKLAEDEFKKFENIHHRFLPLDIDFLINKFLDGWKPNAIFLVDSEIWPNLIIGAKERNIPLALLNARITRKTFKKWIKIRQTANNIFSLFSLCLTSNTETLEYLKKLGAKNIYFEGNLKFFNKVHENKIKNSNHEILLKRKFWFAASIHRGEDKICFKTHINLRKKYRDILTIIAPRHLEKVEEIKTLSEKYSLKTQILNENDLILNDKEIIIINSFGVLNNYFKFAKSVFIGKSILKKFENIGGQNPIEAAVLGCKIYHGPYIYNFKEIYDFFEKNYISQKINNYQELSDNLSRDLRKLNKEKNKGSILINHIGQKTFANTMKKIDNFLSNAI